MFKLHHKENEHKPLGKLPKQILIMTGPGIGDQFLTTPLIRTLKSAYPEVAIDLVVREGRECAFEGNPDVRKIISATYRSSLKRYVSIILRTLFRYDLAITTEPSDRTHVYCLFASVRRLTVLPDFRLKDFWKRLIASRSVDLDRNTHTISQNLELAEKIGLTKCYEIVLPNNNSHIDQLSKNLPILNSSFAVVHAFPGAPSKRWPKERWLEVIEFLRTKNLSVLLSGSPQEEERKYVADIARSFESGVKSIAGDYSFPELAEIIRHSVVYVGTDTATTHLAAATGATVFSVYGPGDSLKWAPWPKGYASDELPFKHQFGLANNGNVWMYRATCSCRPFSGVCDTPVGGESLCLRQLSSKPLIEALGKVLHWTGVAKRALANQNI